MVPAGISLFGHFRQKDRIPFLSSFHQLVHVTGYLPVGNLCIDLRTVDVRMAHHLGDALYRDAGGQHQGSKRLPCGIGRDIGIRINGDMLIVI